MSRIDRRKLNPNFVKSSANQGALSQFGVSHNGGDMFVAHFVSSQSNGSTSNSGDASAATASDASAVSQATLKKAATTGVLALANKNLSRIPDEIWNLEAELNNSSLTSN